MKTINIFWDKKEIAKLNAGNKVVFSGLIYTARDQAHKRLVEELKKGKKLSFNPKNKIIYYCGPAKTPPGKIIGSCGPTTSSRIDEYTPSLLSAGLKAMIGKGRRSQKIIEAIKKHRAVYFLTYAGCGALLSKYVTSAKPVAYVDLGPEAIYELEIKDFPLIVGIDAEGKDIYKRQ